MTKLEAVRAKVIEAVPEIMDLKFGCKVVLHSTRDGEETETTVIKHIKDNLYQFAVGNDVLVDSDEILGRNIGIADVLIAIKVRGESLGSLGATNQITRVAQSGLITFNEIPTCWWHLYKDSLDDQSEETINFLYDILCQNQSSK